MNCNILIVFFCLLFNISFSQAAPIGNKMDDYTPPSKTSVQKNPVVTSSSTTKVKPPQTTNKSSETKPILPKKDVKVAKNTTEKVVNKSVSFHTHKILDDLLSQFVGSNGFVNYKGLKKEEEKLDQYLEDLASNYIESSWSRNQKLAYWINAYNAFTLKLILKNYPLKSIRDLDNGNPWDTKWIKLGGKNLSLNNIENDIIRPTFNEPRIHFAVNCAAKSCPPLMNKAFVASQLDRQLESQTKKFLNNSNYNTLSSKKVEVSKIFEWYKVDFGNLNEFINRYTPENTSNAKIEYNEYDWALNGK